jgi:hypothetical protein
MAKQVNLVVDDDVYAEMVREAGKRQLESGSICSIASLAKEIFTPAARARYNGHNPIDNKPLGERNEAVVVDDKSFDSAKDAEQEAQPQVNDFFKDVSF